MWCGECYSFDPVVTFHVNRLKNEGGESKKDPWDRARLVKVWRNKWQAPDTFLRAKEAEITPSFPSNATYASFIRCVESLLGMETLLMVCCWVVFCIFADESE
jgi:hypothetical protein